MLLPVKMCEDFVKNRATQYGRSVVFLVAGLEAILQADAAIEHQMLGG